MPTPLSVGTRIEEVDLVDLFSPGDGVITQYYGRIGNGKTYNATADVLDLLASGKVVYANWKLQYSGFDERQSVFHIVRGILFPWTNRYFRFPADNLRYIAVDRNFLDNFKDLTDCHVFLDEGHLVFDSYEMAKMSLEKRAAVLHTRHFDRSIHIISQRPTAVHVSMRANVNIFYKCEKVSQWPFLIFKRTEFQDLAQGETVDETKPLSSKIYFANKKVLEAYDSKYLRGDLQPSQKLHFEVYTLTMAEKLSSLLALFIDFLPFKRKKVLPPEAEKILEDQSPPAIASSLGGTGLPESLGVESDLATIKNGERLNTVPVGSNRSQYKRKHKSFDELRQARLRAEFEKDQTVLPF